jgi:hypothetical protein
VTAMPEHAAELERLVAIVRAQGLEADRDA